ncbi:DUF2189 domain-containing protein [Yoonia sp.]|uniref:DUF2189 domain-containing protein n=1 Tax=Yoonia sp. TaxID=2212373 RepID=UPI003F6AA243
MSDLKMCLRKGLTDFGAMRTDVIFIVVIYPVIGALLTWVAINQELLPLVFPLVSGFALLGPIVALGLYEMSRRREAGKEVTWTDGLGVLASPSLIPILVLGFYLVVIFLFWMGIALGLYSATLGPEPPVSVVAFLRDVFLTTDGQVMTIAGVGIGFVFAATVLAISVVSFPLLLDRDVGLARAVVTSVRVTLRNPLVIGTWGIVVTVLLGVGVLTLFVGMIVVLPVLGHATWHLYRQAVVRPEK